MGEGEAVAGVDEGGSLAFSRSRIVSDELERIRAAVQAICPEAVEIAFEYDRALRINIDIRRLEDLARVELLLPRACDGLFSNVQRGLVDNRPFLHRLTAVVDC